jgi:glyoxylase-like metal-dependent hydrolase (beta-lactamase superfamily II)
MKVITLSANNPGIYTGRTGNNTYLLPGSEPTLIDAGVGDSQHLDAIASALESSGTPGLARVVVTHAHSDHATGAASIAARWPGARFFKFPSPERDARYPVRWEPLADGDLVAAGDDRFRVVHTPGHAPDHVALWHAESRMLFGGDLAAASTTVVIPEAEKGGSVTRYLQSLDRILALDPAILLPAHGPAIHEVGRILGRYKAHRHAREQQIVKALAECPRTPDELVSGLYPSIHPELAQSARATVLAHLEKLQEERRASAGPEGIWILSSSND